MQLIHVFMIQLQNIAFQHNHLKIVDLLMMIMILIIIKQLRQF